MKIKAQHTKKIHVVKVMLKEKSTTLNNRKRA